jgi:release factor glutamine methyltransferase
MNINQWLNQACALLKSSSIPTARLDCLVLLEGTLQKHRAWILAHQDEYQLTKKQLKLLDQQVQRRVKHEPLAYIRGKSEFYGKEFFVNNHTLQPRPETETMIDLLKKINTSNIQTIVDVGTGSGAIAVTAKTLYPKLNVIGTDIDKQCITAAKKNAKKHNVRIDFFQGNLIEPLKNTVTQNWIILANLPYVPDSHTINQAAMFEPRHAIFGGKDGLDLYRQLFQQLQTLPAQQAHIFTESLPPTHGMLASIADGNGYRLVQTHDFVQHFIYAG